MQKNLKSLNIAVLRGGWSNERAVSLVSGQAVFDTLYQAGYSVRDVVVERDIPALLNALTPKPDIVFNALHGNGGEDGVIQGVLEMLGIPYTHSGVLASSLAMDKAMAKSVAAQHDIYTAPAVICRKSQLSTPPLPCPFVLKPVSEGSSVGVHIIHNTMELQNALQDYSDDTALLAEQYIPGRELTCGILRDQVLPVIEITPQQGWYDYASKYDAKQHADFTIPAPVPTAIYERAQAYALAAHTAFGCRGVSRSDFRYDPDAAPDQQLVFLELNTQPGMTALSLVPASAAHAGISFLRLIETILDASL